MIFRRSILLLPLLSGLVAIAPASAQNGPSAREPATGGDQVGMVGDTMGSDVVAADIDGPVRLASSPTGQVLYLLRLREGDVLAIDLANPAERFTAVESTAGVRPAAIGVIDSSTLALVVRQEGAWSIRSHQLAAPGMPSDPTPGQVVALGASTAEAADVRLVVSPARDWLAVVGLPDPLPAILRTTITGARLGAASERRCPKPGGRPAALTIGAAGEWGLFLAGERGAATGAGALSWYSPTGSQRLQSLALPGIPVRDAAFCRDSGLLWVAVDEGAALQGRAGLWRVDAAFVGGRQVAKGVAVAPLPAPTSVVCLPKGGVAVSHGADVSRVVRFMPRVIGQPAVHVEGTKGTSP